MRGKNETVWDWAILVFVALLLGMSVWTLSVEYPCMFRPGSMLNRPEMAVRQGLFGVLALALAFGVGQFLPLQQSLRFWWVPLPLFALMLIAIPITSWAGWATMIRGTAWWQRSPGWIAAILVTFSGLIFALPRLAHQDKKTESGGQTAGMAAFAATLLFAAVWQGFGSFALLFVLFGIIGVSAFAVLNGWRRWAGLFVTASACGLALAVLSFMNPRLITRMFSRRVLDYYQGYQAQMAIHAGGWAGCRVHPPEVPEWNTDFIFSRICNVGGLMAGITLLILVGLLLTLAWRIVARQGRSESRALASGCAAVLTVRALLHVAINSGLWPLMPMPLPFLSYGPVFLLFDGALLGVLLALDRTATKSQRLTAGSPSSETENSKGNDGVRLSRWPVTLVQIGIWILLSLFVVRLHWLVFGEHSIRQQRVDRLERVVAREQEQNNPLRGRILDVQGRVLAQPGERHYVCADPYFLADSPDRHLHPDLLRMIGLEADVFEQRTSDTKRRYVRLATVPKTTAEAVKRMNIRGIFIDAQPSRDYPLETPLTHIAGFVNYEMVGAGGIEQMKNADLIAGQDVRMTIDIELQAVVQAIAEYHAAPESRTAGRGGLSTAGAVNPLGVDEPGRESSRLVTPAVLPEVESANARAVQIVVMNPRTGAIRAAAQVPATHGERFPSADPRALTWRSNMDVFEPGGLIQPLVIASALERGVIEAGTVIETDGGFWVHHDIPLRDPVSRVAMTPTEILTLAGNIGMAKIGLQLGDDALYEALVNWGLNTRAATCVPGAEAGMLPGPARWSQIEITRLPIGHGMACTLLQLVRAYTAFFNDGRLVEPYLIEDAPRRDPHALLVPVSGANAAQVREMLLRVVEEGTAKAARMEDVTVFGKTAVVQKAVAGGYSGNRFQTAFIGGFVSDADEPVLIAVWLDEPEAATPDAATSIFRRTALAWRNRPRT